MTIAPIEDVIAAIGRGEVVIVVDDEDRENEGDFIVAADAATSEQLAFVINHSSGYVCVPMLGDDLDRLDLPLMVTDNQDSFRTAYTVSVDAREGVSTGISAADRARTINLLADEATTSEDLVRPGHVIPLRYKPGGVLRRPGHTEASVDLCRLAGRRPAAALCEVVNTDGSMARLGDLETFADEHGLLIGTIADLVAHRRANEVVVERVADVDLPTPYGEWRMIGYRSSVSQAEQVALVLGDVAGHEDVLVRMHSECLTGDIFGSRRCDCGAQLDLAMARIADAGRGVVVYLRGHEGRGIGLLHKLQAYELQDAGADTVEANERLGLPVDARDYGVGALVLADLGLSTLRLMTNNPAKRAAMRGFGLSVTERVPLEVEANDRNAFYLATKRERMGHLLAGDGSATSHKVGDIAAQRATAPARVERHGGAFARPGDGVDTSVPDVPRVPAAATTPAARTPPAAINGARDTDDDDRHYAGPDVREHRTGRPVPVSVFGGDEPRGLGGPRP